ncbi:hypothetical protein [Vibrio vulnificus]|uniref:hypothetical protein n=1 Tax=Vibrio vulnificus TaxID=672 RepID=UPI001FAE7E3B|nr:hypothetical protein [Vibrio vulnificus]MCJ0814909.1 hypothetical protein [Vibrio vulnificus]
MAMDSGALEGLIVEKLQAAGFKTSGQHAQVKVIAKAIAEAVVEHITSSAEVPVTGGSSAGTYKVT